MWTALGGQDRTGGWTAPLSARSIRWVGNPGSEDHAGRAVPGGPGRASGRPPRRLRRRRPKWRPPVPRGLPHYRDQPNTAKNASRPVL